MEMKDKKLRNLLAQCVNIIITNMSRQLIKEVSVSGDPVSFGYRYKGVNYIVSFCVTLPTKGTVIRVELTVYALSRAWLMFASTKDAFKKTLEIDIKDSRTSKEDTRHTLDAIMKALDEDTKIRMFESKEPLTLSFDNGHREHQVEIQLYRTSSDNFKYTVSID